MELFGTGLCGMGVDNTVKLRHHTLMKKLDTLSLLNKMECAVPPLLEKK